MPALLFHAYQQEAEGREPNLLLCKIKGEEVWISEKIPYNNPN